MEAIYRRTNTEFQVIYFLASDVNYYREFFAYFYVNNAEKCY